MFYSTLLDLYSSLNKQLPKNVLGFNSDTLTIGVKGLTSGEIIMMSKVLASQGHTNEIILDDFLLYRIRFIEE